MTPAEQFFLTLIETGKLIVTPQGTAINPKTGNTLGSLSRKKNWFVVAQLNSDKKLAYILLHRLVWLAYHGHIPDGMFVVPLDNDFKNTHPDNLKLISKSANCLGNSKSRAVRNLPPKSKRIRNVSVKQVPAVKVKPEKIKKVKPVVLPKIRQYNPERAVGVKLTADIVITMRRLYTKGWSIVKLGREYDVSKTTVLFAITGRTWRNCEEPVVVIRPIVKKIKEPKPKRVPVPKLCVVKVKKAKVDRVIEKPQKIRVEPELPKTTNQKLNSSYRGRLALIHGW